MKRFKTVEEFMEAQTIHAEGLHKLREILINCDMEECIKWGAPAYTVNGKNVIGIGSFKSYFGLWFHQGVFLKDESKVLMNAQESTKAMRQWRFDDADAVDEKLVRAYVQEAIQNQLDGKEIKPERKKAKIEIPQELAAVFKSDKKLATAFQALTPGKQREYCEHIAAAKREATRVSRAEKAIPLILAGKGLHDKYKNC